MNSFDKMFFVVSLVLSTQLTRFLPLIFKDLLSKLLKFEFIKDHLGDLIIFFLIIYCYRDFGQTHEYLLRVVTGIIVFFIQWKKENSLLSIFLGTAFYMLGRTLI